MRRIVYLSMLLAALTALPCPTLPGAESDEDAARTAASESRRPTNDAELKFWLQNMVWHHGYTSEEMRAATGLTADEIKAAQKHFEIYPDYRPVRGATSLLALPYPGGRHPRIGFRDGAVNPQRETKVSIFTPWDEKSYVVADVPEAIWSNLGLTYLAHTHVPTIWTKQNVELEKLEWQRRDDTTLFIERKLPNGIVYSTKVVPGSEDTVWFEMSLTNGTKEVLSDLRVQNCVMLAHAEGFNQQTNDNKVFAATKNPGSPYVAVGNADRSRWIITGWEPINRPWANPPCPCLHSDPKFPDCAPGQTRYLRGLVTFFEGKDVEGRFKELDETGWRDVVPPESEQDAKQRKDRVSHRRSGLQIICHRGASEFAHENTLEAYRATLELGGDGNEIDIRETKDGVLVCFHDDMLDQILAAYGDVSDYTWSELRRFRFRRPGPFGEYTRIPTLAEVFALHRQYAGLLHLDIKRPGLDHKIAQLLDRFDLWEHVMSAPAENGAALVNDPRFKPLKYKTELYSDHRDVDVQEIEKAMKLEGTALIVDDPRGCIIAAGRKLRSPADVPVTSIVTGETVVRNPHRQALIDSLALVDLANVPDVLSDDSHKPTPSAERILRRAEAIDRLVASQGDVKPTNEELESYVKDRITHKDWRYHGLDAAAALRALVTFNAPNAVDVARECLWRDDPALDSVRDPQYNNPRSWHDWRIKNIVFPLLEQLPGAKTEKVCRDYLAISNEEARKIGPPQFDAAAKTLLTISPNEATALELLNDKRPAVRNRTIKVCLQNAKHAWATSALQKAAPHAIAYIPPQHATPADRSP